MEENEKLSLKDLKIPKSCNYIVEVLQPDGDDDSYRQYIIRDMRTGIPLMTSDCPQDVAVFLSEIEIKPIM